MPKLKNDDGRIRLHDYIVGEVRTFKHSCDNYWMALSAKASFAEKQLAESEDNFFSLEFIIETKKIENLMSKYDEIASIVNQLKSEKIEQIPGLLEMTIAILHENHKNTNLTALEKIESALLCAQKLKDVSKILNDAMERK